MDISKHNADFLSHLGRVMEDPEFVSFFNNYFDDWDNVISAVMLMKAYNALRKKFPKHDYKESVEDLRLLMKQGEFRQLLAQNMLDFMDTNHSNIKRLK